MREGINYSIQRQRTVENNCTDSPNRAQYVTRLKPLMTRQWLKNLVMEGVNKKIAEIQEKEIEMEKASRFLTPE